MKFFIKIQIFSICLLFSANCQRGPALKRMPDTFRDAILTGNLEVVRSFMPLINSSTVLMDAAINTAAIYEENGVVNVLLQGGANANATDSKDGGKTPLHHAAETGNIELIQLLVKNGADINRPALTGGLTPLMSAVTSNSIDSVRVLLDYGTNINKTDHFGNTALSYSIGFNNAEMVMLLIGRNARVDDKRDLYYAASVANVSQRIIVALLKKGADINSHDQIGRTPLYYAVRYKDVDLTT